MLTRLQEDFREPHQLDRCDTHGVRYWVTEVHLNWDRAVDLAGVGRDERQREGAVCGGAIRGDDERVQVERCVCTHEQSVRTILDMSNADLMHA